MKSINNISKKIFLLHFLFIVVIISSCKKLIVVNPPITSVTSASVFTSDATAIAVLTGLYTQLSGVGYNGSTAKIPTISIYAGLSADEFILWSGVTNAGQIAYYKNSLSALTGGYEFWNNTYPLIFACNSAIEGLNSSVSLTASIKQQLLGEAKFMRAFFYFYLVNCYGDVPLVLTTDYTVNASLARTPKVQVYQQIMADLKDAQSFLSTTYLDATLLKITTERVRPTQAAASALLARVFLYTNDYINAETQATAIINNQALYDTVSLNNVFLKNSKEAIWQLQPVTSPTTNTQDALYFIIPASGPSASNPVYLSNSLLNSFEPGDRRKIIGNWVNSVTIGTTTYFYPYKYKINALNASVTEYLTMLRLGEQYLIRAEARAQLLNISGAQTDLNTIRTRAGLPNTTASTQSTLLSAIQNERQVELFAEFGHRWFDLKRTSAADAAMTLATPLKGGTWSSYQQLYPLPITDLQKNSNLIQNPGY